MLHTKNFRLWFILTVNANHLLDKRINLLNIILTENGQVEPHDKKQLCNTGRTRHARLIEESLSFTILRHLREGDRENVSKSRVYGTAISIRETQYFLE